MSELIDSLTEALRAHPEATPLRLHLAELLLNEGQRDRAISELGAVLGKDPANAQAQNLLRQALGAGSAVAAERSDAPTDATEAEPEHLAQTQADTQTPAEDHGALAAQLDQFDWGKLEREVGVDVAPPFITDGSGFDALSSEAEQARRDDRMGGDGPMPKGSHPEAGPRSEPDSGLDENGFIVVGDGEDPKFFEEPQPERIKLADVGGLEQVKNRLRLAFLEPMRNPEIAKAYGKSLRGGLLLYGPPGTGKTYLARAIAGELDAKFLSITIADILDGIMGESEKNVRRIFDRARDLAPCVLFIDELDSLGGKRSGYSNMGWMRNVVNQMLQEMDGVGSNNDGVFILAATNHPWDVDNALLRPGRFDRIVLVTAPDPEARAAILKSAFKDRPIAGIDLDEAVAATHGFSGADLTHLATTAAELAMSDSITSVELRPIGMQDLRATLAEVKPSTGPWLQSARNVVDFANADGSYDDLKNYLEAKQKGSNSIQRMASCISCTHDCSLRHSERAVRRRHGAHSRFRT